MCIDEETKEQEYPSRNLFFFFYSLHNKPDFHPKCTTPLQPAGYLPYEHLPN